MNYTPTQAKELAMQLGFVNLHAVASGTQLAELINAASIKAKSEDAMVRDALILAKDVINILWVSHHANRADAAITAIDAAISAQEEKGLS